MRTVGQVKRLSSVLRGMTEDPGFEVVLTDETPPGERLVVGMAGVGVAGLTATDYLVNNVETTEIGHVRTRNLPDITPFSAGRPRHPIRLYSTTDSGVTVLISEVFLPVWVADPLADAVLEWTATAGVTSVTALHGAPFPHQEHEHVVSHVATDAYRDLYLGPDGGAADIGPLPGGFFDGLLGELLIRSLDAVAPPTGVLVTPTHPPGPDLEAAIRLLGALESVCDITVDEGELRDRAAEMERYFDELAERMQALQGGEATTDASEYPSNRMFM
jgi:uncharacterized protein